MTRNEIKNLILTIEKDFPVNKWKANNIHLWPIIRIRLFFYLFDKYEVKKKSKKQEAKKEGSFFIKSKHLIKSIVKLPQLLLWFLKLPKRKNVFVANTNHRINYNNKLYNRYFDTIIDSENLLNNSLFFDYDYIDINKKYNKSIIQDYYTSLAVFDALFKLIPLKVNFDWGGYSEFVKFLKDRNLDEQVIGLLSMEKLEAWVKDDFILKFNFFRLVFKFIKPENVKFLCYYSSEPLSMVAAANSLNIETIDFQHGPQTDLHMCYSNWMAVPQQGYLFLPNTFHSWDKGSEKNIIKWSKNLEKYKTKVVGNPWINIWKSKNIKKFDNNYILYSLQTFTEEIHFPPPIIELIKNLEYKWYLRLHPRQIKYKNEILNFLEKFKIDDKINIEEATTLPLPQLILNSIINVTHYSGVTIEANLLNKKTIFINKIALDSFPELINQKKAYFLEINSKHFREKFKQIVEKEIAAARI